MRWIIAVVVALLVMAVLLVAWVSSIEEVTTDEGMPTLLDYTPIPTDR